MSHENNSQTIRDLKAEVTAKIRAIPREEGVIDNFAAASRSVSGVEVENLNTFWKGDKI